MPEIRQGIRHELCTTKSLMIVINFSRWVLFIFRSGRSKKFLACCVRDLCRWKAVFRILGGIRNLSNSEDRRMKENRQLRVGTAY